MYLCFAGGQEEGEVSLFENEPRKIAAHEIGQDISLLSVDELGNRIEILRAEIARLEAEQTRKGASKAAAEALFR